jgi:Bacterial CdiA-CT RNAse A domain
MRLAVDGRGYRSAVEAYVTGNLLAVDACRSLSTQLDGYAGMAGDDGVAADFAGSYDEAATESLAALGDLTSGLAALGHLTEASLHNLARADTVSGPGTLADRAMGMRPTPPPSALGGDSSSLPGWANVVLDLLEDVFWPDADTDRLRAAGAAWRAAARCAGLLSVHCSNAISELADEVSPEIPIAIATTEELRARTEALADQLVAVAAACETYADQVDAKRAEMLDLLHELAWELGLGAVASGFLEFVTGGGATPAIGAAGAARVAAASGKVRAILESLSVLTRGTAETLRPVTAAVRDTRAYLSRLAAARRMQMTERGSIDIGAYFGRDPFKPGFLDLHESKVCHTLKEHVGKSLDDLYARFAEKPWLTKAGTFMDQPTAEHAIERVFRKNEAAIRAWLDSTNGKRAFSADLHEVMGRVLIKDTGELVDATRARIVLIKDGSMPGGWRLLTAFPDL